MDLLEKKETVYGLPWTEYGKYKSTNIFPLDEPDSFYKNSGIPKTSCKGQFCIN